MTFIFEAESGNKGEDGGHFLAIVFGSQDMVDHGERIVLTNDTVGALLNRKWRHPRFMNELIRNIPENRDVFANIITIRIKFASKGDRIIDMVHGFEEGREGHPQPGTSVERPISVEEKFIEYFHSFLPRDPEGATGKEGDGGVSGDLMDPSFNPQLCLDGIDQRESSPPFSPLCKTFWTLSPLYLKTDWIIFHLVEVGIVR